MNHTETTHWVTCDNCNLLGPVKATIRAARHEATQLRWACTEQFDLCKRCRTVVTADEAEKAGKRARALGAEDSCG